MQPLKNNHGWQYIFALILMFGFGFYLAKQLPESAQTIQSNSGGQTQINESDPINIPHIGEVWKLLNNKFIDSKKLELDKMKESALKGFVRGLDDPYTLYMTPDESKEFEIDLDGDLEGIGLVLESKDGIITVVSPVKESPAAKAGFKPGDIIYKIDGESTEHISLIQAVKKIRGKKGTQLKITVLRQGEPKPLEFALTRDSIHIESVTYKKLDGVFHVMINQFNDSTEKEFNNVVQEALLEKPTGMIIDVRGNGGGYLDTSIAIISEFLKKGSVVSVIKTRDPKNNETLRAPKDGRLLDIPVVVLIDGGSASASEILAGAFQDHKRGILIGEKSFGKGSVQELQKINNGGLLRLTIAKWYTPNDHNIDETGIKPDIEVKAAADAGDTMTSGGTDKKDPQLEEALKYLKK